MAGTRNGVRRADYEGRGMRNTHLLGQQGSARAQRLNRHLRALPRRAVDDAEGAAADLHARDAEAELT